jgi:hypothetical protein
MPDCIEIVRIVFGEKRIARAQGRVVNPEMSFENLTPARERAKPFPRRCGLTIIPAQIRPGLFAFEDSGDGLLARPGSIGRDIGAVPALRQTHFRRAGRVSIALGPKKRETLKPNMCFPFNPARGYWRVHPASSFAQ